MNLAHSVRGKSRVEPPLLLRMTAGNSHRAVAFLTKAAGIVIQSDVVRILSLLSPVRSTW
ncbi:hypothetical protein PSAC2689_70215 [Paraburkholderia sacchari]